MPPQALDPGSLALQFSDRLHRDEGHCAGNVRQSRYLLAEHDAIAPDVGGADLEQIVEAARDHVAFLDLGQAADRGVELAQRLLARVRSEEHTSELQSLMRISYAVFCLKKKNQT